MEETRKTSQSALWAGGSQACAILVRGGLHDGASISLSEGVHKVSRAPDSALCLQNAGLEGPKSLVLYGGRAALVEPEEVGEALRLHKLPCRLPIGESELEITQKGRPAVSVQAYIPIAAALTLAVLGAVLLFQGAGDVGDSAENLPSTDNETSLVRSFLDERPSTPSIVTELWQSPEDKEQFPLAESLDRRRSEPLLDPMEALSNRIRDLGLGEKLEIQLTEEGLRVNGSLDRNLADKLSDVQAWYDERFSQVMMVQWNIDVDQEMALPPIAIESVWFAGRPHIIANGGQKFFEGSTFGPGWTVSAIKPDSLVFSRQGEDMIIELNSLINKQKAAES